MYILDRRGDKLLAKDYVHGVDDYGKGFCRCRFYIGREGSLTAKETQEFATLEEACQAFYGFEPPPDRERLGMRTYYVTYRRRIAEFQCLEIAAMNMEHAEQLAREKRETLREANWGSTDHYNT